MSAKLFLFLLYVAIGLVQLFAIRDGIEKYFEIGTLISFIIAIFLTYIPLVGSALGVYGAHIVWKWDIVYSVILFFWYVPVVIIFLFRKLATK